MNTPGGELLNFQVQAGQTSGKDVLLGPQDGQVVYLADVVDSRLQGDSLVPLGSSPTKSQKKRPFWLAAHTRLTLSLPLSFSSSFNFLSLS